MEMEYEIYIIRGNYCGHRPHTISDRQTRGSGISSTTVHPPPKKIQAKCSHMENIENYRVFLAKIMKKYGKRSRS